MSVVRSSYQTIRPRIDASAMASLQSEQCAGVARGNLSAVALADGGMLDPAGRRLHHLVGIVDREQNAVRADCEYRRDQCLVVEVSARRYVKVIREIVLQPPLDA